MQKSFRKFLKLIRFAGPLPKVNNKAAITL